MSWRAGVDEPGDCGEGGLREMTEVSCRIFLSSVCFVDPEHKPRAL
ncbi:MAG: hypothetical protein HGA57_09565 [Chlorobium limicola]|nr:hypothetical protein [Chlorobium limicola]NTV21610.1 hypothetical protein [Chlorobium limicola]